MYGCESGIIKKAELWRIDAFELWCWRRLLRVPWTARWSNQSIPKEISPEYSLEGLMLKLQYFGHLMQRADSLENTLMLGKFEGQRRKGWQRMKWLDGITNFRFSIFLILNVKQLLSLTEILIMKQYAVVWYDYFSGLEYVSSHLWGWNTVINFI